MDSNFSCSLSEPKCMAVPSCLHKREGSNRAEVKLYSCTLGYLFKHGLTQQAVLPFEAASLAGRHYIQIYKC